MRRVFADRLVLATAAIVIGISLLLRSIASLHKGQ
jgi:hypothetical protein